MSLEKATADAIVVSVATAAKLCEAGDLEGARRALERAEGRLADLRAAMPSHARLVRQSAEAILLARRALAAPKRQENEETGLIEPVRERLAHRAIRASARARA
jgi:hypothetical protein